MTVRLLHLTDTHFPGQPGQTLYQVDTERSCRQVLAQAFDRHGHFDLLVLTGDLAHDPKNSEPYQRLAACLTEFGTEALCLPGNHDHSAWMAETLIGSVHCRRERNLSGWQLLALNSQIPGSAVGYLAQAELAWLRQMLAQPVSGHRLILLHHNPLPTGSAWLDTMTLGNGAELLALLGQAPTVKGLLHGHVHQAIDQTLNGLRILATPSTCVQFRPHSAEFALDDKPPAYRIIELADDGRMRTEVHWLEPVAS